MAKAIEAGIPKLRIEEAAAKTQARIDAGRQTVVGVNKYLPDQLDDVPVLKVDNAAVRRQQIAKLERLRAARNPAAVETTLAALTAGAQANGNLLALAIDAVRARATVGEISSALESVFDRHVAPVRLVEGVFAKESGDQPKITRARSAVAAFKAAEGRAPSLLVAKLGQDGHDRGQKVVATGFKDFGFEVEVGPLFQTPAEAAALAVAKGVHAIGASSLAGAHLSVAPELKAELVRLGHPEIMVVVGGVIPPDDVQPLLDAGAAAIYLPGAVLADAALDLLDKLNVALGYAQRSATP